jgi:hypothetical protein
MSEYKQYTDEEIANWLATEFQPIFYRARPYRGDVVSMCFRARKYYTQKFSESTCLPISVVNANECLGLERSTPFIRKLMNFSLQEDEGRADGMTYDDLMRLVDEEQDLPFKLKKSDKVYGPKDLGIDLKRDYEQKIIDLSKKNKEGFREEFANNRVLLASVDTLRYFDDVMGGGIHAISLVGYMEYDSGQFDIQILDPSVGNIFMGIEQLTYSLFESVYTLHARKDYKRIKKH